MSAFLLNLLVVSLFSGFNSFSNQTDFPYDTEAEKRIILSQVIKGHNPEVARNFWRVISLLEKESKAGNNEAYRELQRWQDVKYYLEHIQVTDARNAFGPDKVKKEG